MIDIQLLRLHVENFRSLTDFTLDFNTGLTIIKGPNGAGKSSIFNAVYTCITGRQLNGRPASSAIQHGKDTAKIYLELSVNGQIYYVTRNIGKVSGLVIETEGNKTTGKQAKTILDELVPSDILKLYMLQDLNLTQLIAKFVDIDTFTKNVRDKIQETELQIQKENEQISLLENSIQQLDTNIEYYKAEINQTKSNIYSLTQQLDIVQSQIDGIDKEKLLQFRTEYQQKINNLDNELRQELSDKYSNQKLQIENEISKIQSELNRLLLQLDNTYNNFVSEKQSELTKLQSESQNITKEIKHYEQLLEQGKCFVCNREIKQDDIPHYQEILDNLNKQLKETNEKSENIKQQLTQFKQEYQNKKTELSDRANNKIKQLQEQLQELEIVKQDIVNKYSSPQIKEDIKQELLQKYQLSENELSIDLTLFDKVIDLKNRIAVLQENLKSLENKLKQLEDEKAKRILELSKAKTSSNIDKLQKQLELLQIWTDTRTLKKVLIKEVSKSINKLLEHQNLNKVQLVLDDKDNIVLMSSNSRGELIPIEDVSTGENVLARLQLYMALLELFASQSKLNTLFLDEVLDSLDDTNQQRVLIFLKELSQENNMGIYVITHRDNMEVPDYALNIEL